MLLLSCRAPQSRLGFERNKQCSSDASTDHHPGCHDLQDQRGHMALKCNLIIRTAHQVPNEVSLSSKADNIP